VSNWLERIWYPPRQESALRRVGLSPLTFVAWWFRLIVSARARGYASGRLQTHRVEGLRVISVGNLNVGGAGKTPAVIHLAGLLTQAGVPTGILTRGYGRRSSAVHIFQGKDAQLPSAHEVGDEPLLLARRVPDAFIGVGADRVELAHRLRAAHGVTTVLLDDGMQHRRLARDAELVVIDEDSGFGNGRLLPRGPLRESPDALSRASLIWLRAGKSRRRTSRRNEIPFVVARHVPEKILTPAGAVQPATAVRGLRVLAFAAIARPSSFRKTLEEIGTVVAGETYFPDHHLFTPKDLEKLRQKANQLGAALITTEKDHVRLPPSFGTWVVRIEVRIEEGAEHLTAALGL
jgi:tetraacyldisaccharide 4'-kinase